MTTAATTGSAWVPELTFAARLALVRNRMGWNAKEAALACGLPAQSWRNWEATKRPHDFEAVCRKIADRTGCDLAWLMGASNPRVTGEYPTGNRGFSAAA